MEIFLSLCKKDKHWESLKDIPVPGRFKWIWSKFLEIWRGCERDMSGRPVFSFATINSYCECMNVPLTAEDKRELFKIKVWAFNAISELEEE